MKSPVELRYITLAQIIGCCLVILGPICGAMADHKDTRKLFFSTSVAIGVICCVMTGFTKSYVMFIAFYMITRLFYQASNTFYDSMLNDVTTDERSDAVSSYGYAWGYIGSCIPFVLALICFVLGPKMVGVISDSLSKILGFSITAIWWLVVTLPLFKNYKQINYVEGKIQIGKTFSHIWSTLKSIALKDKKVLLFLIAFFLYIDGVGTIIDNCVTIGKAVGLENDVALIIFLLATQVVAFAGSLVFAKLSKKYSTVNLLLVCIVGYFAVCVYGLFIKSLLDFAIMAFMVGCFQGSIQSLSRSYYSRIIPDENSSEYFGLYDIFSKGASLLGSVVIALVCNKLGNPDGTMIINLFGKSFTIGSINIAVFLLCVFFFLGFFILKAADKAPQSDESKKDII